MFLRSLTMRGFKSFADRTTLEFTPGVSVIVGPNGSGKSNIADAIAWVLGEQGPRALRGGQMADVIFAGSPTRPGLGMAEVSLVIDNSGGLIPVPASEIEISRSILRSGDSEYRLGGRPCRLLDIQEILSDTGVGRALHTVIGQGQLEDVLSARPEERRQLVEEAAGIAKHRRRRERAERKLAGLEQDLLRLQDVVGELRRQLKPLKQQAELATRHEQLSKEAADLAEKLAAARLRELHAERDRRRPSWQEAEAKQAEARARVAQLDREIEALEAERSAAEGDQRAEEERYERALGAKSEAEGRLRAAIRDESRARERLASATNRSGRLFALEEELERTERAREEVRLGLAEREASLEAGEREFGRLQRARRDAEEERRQHGEEAAARRAEAETLQRTLAAHRAEGRRLAGELQSVRARIAESETLAERLEEEVERLDALETPLVEQQAALERDRSSLATDMAALEAEEKGLLARQEVVESRKDELSRSAAAAFAGRREERTIGVMRDLIEAPPDLRAAVRAALGAFADSVVYGSGREALADVTADGAGGLTFAVADGASAQEPGARLPGERRLLDAVRLDPRVRALAERLLGDVYLTHNAAEAAAKHRVHPEVTFVTPEGVTVGPGFVRPAPGHDVRLDRVRREAAGLDRDLASVRMRLREGRRRLGEIEAEATKVRAALERADRQITEAAERMATAKAELGSLRREEQLLAERVSAAEAAAAGAWARLAEAPTQAAEPPDLPPIPEPPIRLRVEVEAMRRDLARLEAGVARARRDIDDLAAEDPVALRRTQAEAEGARTDAEEALRLAEAHVTAGAESHREASRTARAAHDRAATATRVWREASVAVEELRQEHQQEDRARLDLERRIADAERVLREGHGADPAVALEALTDEDSAEALQRRADLVARRLGLLGRVNLLATGELESLQERHDFMVRELDDVRAARRDLEDVIHEVNRKMAELFEQAYRDVAAEFAALFARLFPGGEGRLTLTDPDDPLVAGIEVEARPGRKRVKRLSLLSGGERSLAALAFLFAIFRARPSPFYLLDEVEAALDDINLHRFLEVVREFAERSQIIVVTHQKRTMEMADVLYGVSMGSGGASRVISQRLAEVAAG